MNYKGHLTTGEEVLLQKDGEQTRIQLQSGDTSKHESQSTSFKTGEWSVAPSLFAAPDGAVLKIESESGPIFVEIKSNGISRLSGEPDLKGAESVALHETDEAPASIEMKPMAPMKPMEPLKPLS